MKKRSTRKAGAPREGMRREYRFDYTKARPNRFAAVLRGTTAVVLEPDVAKAFRSSAAVNEALRSLLKMAEATRRLTTRSGGRRSA